MLFKIKPLEWWDSEESSAASDGPATWRLQKSHIGRWHVVNGGNHATREDAKQHVELMRRNGFATFLVPATEEEILEAAYEIQKKAKDELGKVTRAALSGHFSRKDSQ